MATLNMTISLREGEELELWEYFRDKYKIHGKDKELFLKIMRELKKVTEK